MDSSIMMHPQSHDSRAAGLHFGPDLQRGMAYLGCLPWGLQHWFVEDIQGNRKGEARELRAGLGEGGRGEREEKERRGKKNLIRNPNPNPWHPNPCPWHPNPYPWHNPYHTNPYPNPSPWNGAFWRSLGPVKIHYYKFVMSIVRLLMIITY